MKIKTEMWLMRLFQIIDKSFIGKFIDKRLDLLNATNPERIYIENIRSFYNLNFDLAKTLCEMAVKEKLFKKRIGVECPECDKLIKHYPADSELPDEIILCENCQLLEKEKQKFKIQELNKLVFYQLNQKDYGKVQ